MSKIASHPHVDQEFSAAFSNAVRIGLESSGYDVLPIDTQDWMTHLTLTRDNTDGSLSLYFGPVVEDENGTPGRLKFQIIREMETTDGFFDVPADLKPEEAADAFVSAIFDHLTNQPY